MGTAPVPEKVSTTTTGTMSVQQIEAMARIVYDAFNARELDRAAALVSDDCEWLDVVSNNVFRGPAGFLEFDNGWITAFPDAHIQVSNVVCSGDLVFTEFIGSGTHDGNLRIPTGHLLAPSGQKIEVRCVEVLQMRDGKIIRARTYYDAFTMLRQLGVLQPS